MFKGSTFSEFCRYEWAVRIPSRHGYDLIHFYNEIFWYCGGFGHFGWVDICIFLALPKGERERDKQKRKTERELCFLGRFSGIIIIIITDLWVAFFLLLLLAIVVLTPHLFTHWRNKGA